MEIDIKAVINSYWQITLFILMFSIGLTEGFSNLSTLWRRPSLLIRCLIASLVLVPLAAILILVIVPMPESARIGLGLMAVCPGAPMMYKKLTKMHANMALAGSFQVTTALSAVLVIPIWIIIFAQVFPNTSSAGVVKVFKQVMGAQIIPILMGLSIREWLADLADDLQEPVTKIGNFLFLGAVLVILVVALPVVLKVGVVTVIGVVLFIAAAIVIGHYLAGPDPESRLTIALANSTRNAGLAMAIAALDYDDPGILGAIGAIALLAFVADAIYVNLYRKQLAKAAQASS